MRSHRDNTLQEPGMAPPPLAPDEKDDNSFGLNYRVDVIVMNIWTDEILNMKGSVGYLVLEPDIADDFGQFSEILYGANGEKRMLR